MLNIISIAFLPHIALLRHVMHSSEASRFLLFKSTLCDFRFMIGIKTGMNPMRRSLDSMSCKSVLEHEYRTKTSEISVHPDTFGNAPRKTVV